MNLEVVLVPDPERFRVHAARTGHPAPTRAAVAIRAKTCIPYKRASITGFADVRNWANEIYRDVAMCGGPYFLHLHIREATGKIGQFMKYEMPHGDMHLEDRLWIPIDMHEAFYVDVT